MGVNDSAHTSDKCVFREGLQPIQYYSENNFAPPPSGASRRAGGRRGCFSGAFWNGTRAAGESSAASSSRVGLCPARAVGHVDPRPGTQDPAPPLPRSGGAGGRKGGTGVETQKETYRAEVVRT